MPVPIWMLTLPVVLEDDLTLALEIEATIFGSGYTFDDSNIPYPEIPAGKYAFFVFLAMTNTLLRQWILDVADDLTISTRPSLANTLLKFIVPNPLVPTRDGNKLTVTFDTTGFAIGANAMTLDSA